MNKWKRSVQGRMFGGVCAGLAAYLDLDVKLVRAFFIAAAMLGGVGALAYLALWLLTPLEGQEAAERSEVVRAGWAEVQEEARGLGNALQGALERDDPQTRMVVRWALAVLVGLAAQKMRSRRRHTVRVEQHGKPEPAEEEA